MLFSKDIEPHCGICLYSRQINENDAVCNRKGVVSLRYHCRKFKYDATKRVPSVSDFSIEGAFSPDDFSLDRD